MNTNRKLPKANQETDEYRESSEDESEHDDERVSEDSNYGEDTSEASPRNEKIKSVRKRLRSNTKSKESRNKKESSEKIKNNETMRVLLTTKKIARRTNRNVDERAVDMNEKSDSEDGKAEESANFSDDSSHENEKKEANSDIEGLKTCNICSDQRVPFHRRSHAEIHGRSKFVSDLMKKFYKKASDKTKIVCTACSLQNKKEEYLFDHNLPFKHLCDFHLTEFQGHEKEFLKSINFFVMMKMNKNDAKFHKTIEDFVFNYNDLTEFVKMYFSNSNETRPYKKLFLGKKYLDLKELVISNGLRPDVNNQTKMLIDTYLKQKKRETKDTDKDDEKREKTDLKRTGGRKKEKINTNSKENNNSVHINYEFIIDSNKRILKETHELDKLQKAPRIEPQLQFDNIKPVKFEDTNDEQEDERFIPDNMSEFSCNSSHIPIQVKLAQTEKTLGSVYQQLTRQRIKLQYTKGEYEKKIARLKHENIQVKSKCLVLETELKKAAKIIELLKQKL